MVAADLLPHLGVVPGETRQRPLKTTFDSVTGNRPQLHSHGFTNNDSASDVRSLL